jgi:dihydroxyacetone kinase-like protein
MPKHSLNVTETVEMLKTVAHAVIAAEPELTDADRNLGDGDHGIGMQRGMTAVLEKLSSGEVETITKAFTTMGMAMMSSMGGASGAIFGTMFRSAGKAIESSDILDSSCLADLLVAGNEGVMTRGGAKPGDKTMIDALAPAASKAKESIGMPLHEALSAVAGAAEDGRNASKQLVATMGRAKTLGEKSIGFPDAGACSIAIILRAMADFVA